MTRGGMRWVLGILAIALWAGAPFATGQQQPTKQSTPRREQQTQKGSTNAGSTRTSSPGVSSRGAGATASGIPESGTPTLENQQPTGTLNTLPNQTLTPGATTVPSNAGGIAPASNDASSGDYTPSEGRTAPTTPGGNPSETQGVPTFSSAAQPMDANLPRVVNPPNQSKGQTATSTHKKAREQRTNRSSKPGPQ